MPAVEFSGFASGGNTAVLEALPSISPPVTPEPAADPEPEASEVLDLPPPLAAVAVAEEAPVEQAPAAAFFAEADVTATEAADVEPPPSLPTFSEAQLSPAVLVKAPTEVPNTQASEAAAVKTTPIAQLVETPVAAVHGL